MRLDIREPGEWSPWRAQAATVARRVADGEALGEDGGAARGEEAKRRCGMEGEKGDGGGCWEERVAAAALYSESLGFRGTPGLCWATVILGFHA